MEIPQYAPTMLDLDEGGGSGVQEQPEEPEEPEEAALDDV